MGSEDTLFYLVSGLVLGLSGGLAPGPLTALVVSQTLRFGRREGMLVAFAPLITDGPLVIAAAWVLGRAAEMQSFLGALSLGGGAVLVWLAIDTWRAQEIDVEAARTLAPGSIKKSVATNLLNPHPYLFWFVVGGPLVVRSWNHSVLSLVCFLAGFFGCLVGSKMAMAVVVSRVGGRLNSAGYRWTMRALGVALAVFAVMFVADGAGRLGWL